MKVVYNARNRMWTVRTNHMGEVVFSHKSRTECYEWIFSHMSYVLKCDNSLLLYPY